MKSIGQAIVIGSLILVGLYLLSGTVRLAITFAVGFGAGYLYRLVREHLRAKSRSRG